MPKKSQINEYSDKDWAQERPQQHEDFQYSTKDLVQGMWVLFRNFSSIGHLDLISVWSSENQRINTIKAHLQKRMDCVFKFI